MSLRGSVADPAVFLHDGAVVGSAALALTGSCKVVVFAEGHPFGVGGGPVLWPLLLALVLALVPSLPFSFAGRLASFREGVCPFDIRRQSISVRMASSHSPSGILSGNG